MKIAENETARAYDRLQKSINWDTASDYAQIEVMLVIKQLLIEARSYTPIFDFQCTVIETGQQSVRTANEQLGNICRRLYRYQKNLKANAV